MTVAEKLEVIDTVWQDLRKHDSPIPVPEWHLRILEERERALENGEDEFLDFDIAMAEIRERIETRRNAK